MTAAWRWAGRLTAAAAVLAAAAAGAVAVWPAEPEQAVELVSPETDVGEIRPGDRTVEVWVRNRSGRPLRVVGLNEACGRNCCLSPPPDEPPDLSPRAVTSVPLRLHAPAAGPFHAETQLFVQDVGGVRQLAVVVRGVVSE
jgi:hypothetical protein